MSEFNIRILVSIIGILLIFLVLYFNGIILNIGIFFLTLIGLFEINKAFNKLNIKNKNFYFLILAIFNSIELYFNREIIFTIYLILFIALFDLLFLRKNIIDISALVFSALYIILGFSSIILIDDPVFIGLIFVIAFSTDSFAYLVGITFGKHKLIPDVSPKKSIEGSLGGIIGTIILVTIYLSYFNLSNIGYDIILGVLGSIIAQCGDLVASRIKRDTGIKDFGSIIPGHGGILDRFDSVILVAPVVYFLVNLLYI